MKTRSHRKNDYLCASPFCRARWEYDLRGTGERKWVLRVCVEHAQPSLGHHPESVCINRRQP